MNEAGKWITSRSTECALEGRFFTLADRVYKLVGLAEVRLSECVDTPFRRPVIHDAAVRVPWGTGSRAPNACADDCTIVLHTAHLARSSIKLRACFRDSYPAGCSWCVARSDRQRQSRDSSL